MVRFVLPYLLGAGKSSLYRTKSETQKDHLIVKTTERKKQCVTFKTCSHFSVVTSVAMRAFLQERSEKYFQNELLESIRRNNQFGVLRLERARPQRRLRGGDVRAKITLFKKMTAEVSEIKLVKLLMISLTEKYTHDATLYWSDVYCLLQKGNSVTTKIIFKLFSTSVKEKK